MNNLLLHIIPLIIGIPVWFYILNYILQLESIGCLCALDWRHTYIKYFIIFILIMMFMQIFNLWNPSVMSPIILTIQFVVTIIYVIIVFSYIYNLKNVSCFCSEDLARDILEIMNYIQIAMIIFALIFIIYTLFAVAQLSNENTITTPL
jgi:hypothetical protein